MSTWHDHPKLGPGFSAMPMYQRLLHLQVQVMDRFRYRVKFTRHAQNVCYKFWQDDVPIYMMRLSAAQLVGQGHPCPTILFNITRIDARIS